MKWTRPTRCRKAKACAWSKQQGEIALEQSSHKLEQAALRLLGKREHSRLELRRKLNACTADQAQLEALLDRLVEQGAQSDLRFAQGYVYRRAQHGFGPLRIHMELTECGIDAQLADACIDADDEESWDQRLLSCVAGKFGKEPPAGYNEWAKRARFLEYRGFSRAQIRRLLPE